VRNCGATRCIGPELVVGETLAMRAAAYFGESSQNELRILIEHTEHKNGDPSMPHVRESAGPAGELC
jgi:hypothetical protein